MDSLGLAAQAVAPPPGLSQTDLRVSAKGARDGPAGHRVQHCSVTSGRERHTNSWPNTTNHMSSKTKSRLCLLLSSGVFTRARRIIVGLGTGVCGVGTDRPCLMLGTLKRNGRGPGVTSWRPSRTTLLKLAASHQ